jgi:hypothetical protein
MSKKVHLINEAGHRIEVESSEYEDNQLLNENKYSNYYIDIDWYLANGYMTLEDAINFIENGNN